MSDDKKIALVIDGNNMGKRAFFAHSKKVGSEWQGLKTSDGRDSSVVFGVANMVSTLTKKFKPDYLLFLFDWGKSKHRTEILGSYKGSRVGNPEMEFEFDALRRLISHMNLAQFQMQDVEADDLIASAKKMFSDQDIRTVIVSSDHDFFQLVDDMCYVFRPKHMHKPQELYTPDKVLETQGIEAERLIEVASLSGDMGDDVPGVKGIGHVTALKLIKKYGDLPSVLESDEKKIKGNVKDAYEAFQLIRLDPERYQIPFQVGDCVFRPERGKTLRDFCESWELKSVTKALDEGTFWPA